MKLMRVYLMRLIRLLRMPYCRGLGCGIVIGMYFVFMVFDSIELRDISIPWHYWAIQITIGFSLLVSVSEGLIAAWKQVRVNAFGK